LDDREKSLFNTYEEKFSGRQLGCFFSLEYVAIISGPYNGIKEKLMLSALYLESVLSHHQGDLTRKDIDG